MISIIREDIDSVLIEVFKEVSTVVLKEVLFIHSFPSRMFGLCDDVEIDVLTENWTKSVESASHSIYVDIPDRVVRSK